MLSLNVSKEVKENVNKYFEKNLNKYEVLAVGHHTSKSDNIYTVLGRYKTPFECFRGNFAVWTSWNEETQSLNFGHYCLLEDTAMAVFNGDLSSCNIDRDRLVEIASRAIDGLLEDDEESALVYLKDELDLTKEECEFFGVDYEKMESKGNY